MASCNICLMEYEPITIRPLVGSCGHTLCEPCSKKINKHCPTCRKLSFDFPAVNYEVLEMIQNGGDSCCHRKSQGFMKQMEKKFNDKVEEIKAKMEAMEPRFQQELSNSLQPLEKRLQFIEERVYSLEVIDNVKHKLAVVKNDVEILKELFKETRKRKCGIEVAGSSKDLDNGHNLSAKRVKVKTGAAYKCIHCGTSYPTEIVLRTDGVSTVCPNRNCKSWLILGKLKEQHRWVFMRCEEGSQPHFQQISVDDRDETNICLVCGTEGVIHDFPDLQTANTQAGPSPGTEAPGNGTSGTSQNTITASNSNGEGNGSVEAVAANQ